MTDEGMGPLKLGLTAGSPEAFAVLYDRYAGRLYRAALAMLGRREDAEDALQDVFTAMVRSRRKLLEVSDLTAYLFTALRRAAGRIAESRARHPTASQAVEQMHAEPDCTRSYSLHSDRLVQARRALPAEQREVIALKIDGELTFAEIGQVLCISPNTAASRYRYALEKLRRSLKE
jgi:RNA polymerase sigma-70 factor (ECF subfamily)